MADWEQKGLGNLRGIKYKIQLLSRNINLHVPMLNINPLKLNCFTGSSIFYSCTDKTKVPNSGLDQVKK